MNHLENFHEFKFPDKKGIVYALCARIELTSGLFPFYVGQSTSRSIGRFGDYVSGKFTAATDYKVGEAISYLVESGFQVVVKYKAVEKPAMAESELIRALDPNRKTLLNWLPGYNYKTADPVVERARIRAFMAELVKAHWSVV